MQDQINYNSLSDELDDAAILSRQTIWSRIKRSPFRYLVLQLNRHLVYRITKKRSVFLTKLLNVYPFYVALPSGADIYLLGMKSHDSEIRLSRFLLTHLAKYVIFLDIGAHFGYYSVLAALKTENYSRVIAFEPGDEMFEILTKNIQNLPNVSAYQLAASDQNGTAVFYDYPTRYNEFSSLKENVEVKGLKPKETTAQTVKLDDWFKEKDVYPDYVKIDVEGTEFNVLKGMEDFLKEKDPYIMIEYFPHSQDTNYEKALEFMLGLEYKVHVILEDGSLYEKKQLKSHFEGLKHTSDNIVFKKR